MIGLSKNNVHLYPYSEEWTTLFEKEKINLYNCIGDYVVDIQHVGSTSIKGMHSKPIIDIVVGLKDFNDGFKIAAYNFKKLLAQLLKSGAIALFKLFLSHIIVYLHKFYFSFAKVEAEFAS